MFTLRQLAYAACEKQERAYFDKLDTPLVDIRRCCIDIMKSSTANFHFDECVERTVTRFSTLEKAALEGHVECMQYAYMIGCCWTYQASLIAVISGNLYVLQYLVDNSCPLDVELCLETAIEMKYQDIEHYLRSKFHNEIANLLLEEF